ncbi:MAG: Gfo/Idh/MocA family oxidoreductase [Phycisphaerae bacterium]|nr:Gfo/Idh/MocA family oxidoreductase [Phycisphaerae bacterium]
MIQNQDRAGEVSRREFVKAGALAATAMASGLPVFAAHAAGADSIRVGVIGLGGRGTGAAVDSLSASPKVRIVALADAFADRLSGSLEYLKKGDDVPEELRARVDVPEDRRFVGFDAYKKLLASDVDLVILATPPHFRPIHFEAAVAAGKHVFMEKPVAVCPAGVRRVLAAAEEAKKKSLAVVTGTQRRHESCYLEAMKRLGEGAIGKIVSARVYWNQGALWSKKQEKGWSDMEWQLRNWLYFTWLSGDHIVEQHVHNLDVMNWAMGANPVRCWAMGGRQVRTEPVFGHIFDHFAVEYEYPGGAVGNSFCRQIEGCANRVEENIIGTDGVLLASSGRAEIRGKNAWKFAGENGNPYRIEHVDLIASIEARKPLNEAKRIAESTLTAIMGRMAAYTGKEITWEAALNSKLDLSPSKYEFGSIEVPAVAIPGKTPLI